MITNTLFGLEASHLHLSSIRRIPCWTAVAVTHFFALFKSRFWSVTSTFKPPSKSHYPISKTTTRSIFSTERIRLWRVPLDLLSVGIAAPIASDYHISPHPFIVWNGMQRFDDGQVIMIKLSLTLFFSEDSDPRTCRH